MKNLQIYLAGLLFLFISLIGFLSWKVNNNQPKQLEVKTFNFVLENKEYKPDTVTVKLGDTVIFNINNKDDENHGLHLPEFGVEKGVPPLKKTSIKFTATKVGTTSTSCASGHPEKINVVVKG